MPRPLSDSPNPDAGLRAAAELARDPARSDVLIAIAAACTDRTVLRMRRILERRGTIPAVPRLQRAGWALPSRNPGAGARAQAELALDAARSNRAIARAALCSDHTVLAARRAALLAAVLAQVHTVSMGRANAPHQTRVWAGSDDKHALTSMTDPLTRPEPRFTYEPDPIETECPGCTLIRAGGWRHDPACIFAGRKVRASALDGLQPAPRPAAGRR